MDKLFVVICLGGLSFYVDEYEYGECPELDEDESISGIFKIREDAECFAEECEQEYNKYVRVAQKPQESRNTPAVKPGENEIAVIVGDDLHRNTIVVSRESTIGDVIDGQGLKYNPETDHISLDGKAVRDFNITFEDEGLHDRCFLLINKCYVNV